MFQLNQLLFLLVSSIVVINNFCTAKPQQEQNIQDTIAQIFTTSRPRGGFGDIVTAEPEGSSSSQSQFFNQNDDNTNTGCKCVQYYLCNPTDSTIITEVEDFGNINIGTKSGPEVCEDVLDVCCGEQKVVEKPIPVRPIQQKPNRAQGCGIRNPQGIDFELIGNLNNEAGFGEFPWTVALITISNEKYICAGSLIHPQVVLTANHCVRKIDARNLKIRAGEWDTQTVKERLAFQERSVSKIISHPDYVIKTVANDYTGSQFFQENTGGNCKCVRYDQCNPTDDENVEEVDGFGILDIRFGANECTDVLDVCCNDDKVQDKPIPVRPIDQTPNRAKGCGIRTPGGIDFQLSGNLNNEAGFGEFPWTVALIRNTDETCLCGGSLIHPQVVLTGNHCVRQLNARILKVRAGEWDTQTVRERLPYQERMVSQIINHPEYVTATLANDLALLVLQQPFQLADHINVVCLPPQNYITTSPNCFATGWGKDLFGKKGKYSVIMKRVPLPVIPNDQCENALRATKLGPYFSLSPTFICAGGEKGVDTCEGDGGAPLVCPVGLQSDNRYSQSGIVAWGIGCNEARPAVYASVALARNWIDSQMRNLGFDPSVYTY